MENKLTDAQKAFETKWLNKTVRLRNTSDYQLPKTTYQVTGALFDYYDEKDKQTVFAIMSSEYSLPDKPWWYTMYFGNGDDVDPHLDKHFEIV